MSQLKTDPLLSYEDFQTLLQTETAKRLGAQYRTELVHVVKNNSTQLDGLVIRKEASPVGPNLYLNELYEEYRAGNDLETIIKELILDYHSFSRNSQIPETEFCFDYDSVKDRIIYCLVGADSNQAILKASPHIRFLDFAIIFQYLAVQDSSGIGTVRITNEHMKLWNADVSDLMKLAAVNTVKLLPAKVMTMSEVLTVFSPESGAPACVPESDRHSMYVLTNSAGLQGATCILYPGILEQFAAELNSDLFLLPSSVHEFLLIPASETLSLSQASADRAEDEKDALSEIVREINTTQIKPEDVLTNHAYYYHSLTKILE